MQTNLTRFILSSPKRLALPLGIYPGLQLTGKTVAKVAHDFLIQANASFALAERYHSPFLQTAMDISVEAETFGAQIDFDAEVPVVSGRLITRREDVSMLFQPKVGYKRTIVPLSVIPELKDRIGFDNRFILGSMSGPFTLAGLLFGLDELIALTDSDPAFALDLLKLATNYLVRYAEAQRGVGADGIIMAECSAGMLSPQKCAKFSTPFVRQIIESLQTDTYSFVYHNCMATMDHLDDILRDGAAIHHFGSRMEFPAGLQRVDGETVLAGNLDAAEILTKTNPDQVYEQTLNLLHATAGYKNFLVSSNCDLSLNTPIPNLDAFHKALTDFNGV